VILGISRNNYAELCSFLKTLDLKLTLGQNSRVVQAINSKLQSMNVALVEPIKKGGRYTKKEQEERRLQVHHLRFDENKSAVEIAKLLNVNRNTISDDIKFWLGQLANESNVINIAEKMIRLLQKMEIQRVRFLEYLDEAENLVETIRIEKLISELDARLVQYYSKSIFNNRRKLSTHWIEESLDFQG